MVIVNNGERMYLGEVLDMFKKVGRLHGFVESTEKYARLSNLALRVYLPLDKVRLQVFYYLQSFNRYFYYA